MRKDGGMKQRAGEQILQAGEREWNLTLLFRGDDDALIERDLKSVGTRSRAFVKKWKDRRDYLADPRVLRKALDDYEALWRNTGTDGGAGYYFWLRTQQDQNDPALKARFNKIEEFSRNIENELRFFYLRLCKIPLSRQKTFLEHSSLAKYRHYIERAFVEARYLLSEPEERILAVKSSTSHSQWVKMTSGFLAKEERQVLLEDGSKPVKSFSEVLSLINNRHKRVRDKAAAAFNDILAVHSDVAEAELNAILANKKSDDELRKIERPDLARHISDDMESEVVDALVAAVARRFDIPARFYALKAELLGLKRLQYHERNVEYGATEKKYPFDEAVGLVHKVFSRLDREFASILDRFLKGGQFDVFPRKGKASGAFCAHHLPVHPTYVLLNHTNQLNDVLTLAHEMGHGINNELIRASQHALYFGTPLSTAEVASTFMEDFVLQEVLHDAGDELRLSLMVRKLGDDVSTIFRQVACYRFEQELHAAFREKGYLSKADVGALFRKHMEAYMGQAVEQSPGSENWWIYWGHIRTFFYVYSYAGGLLISKSLQHAVKEDSRFIGKVKAFLSAGLSDSPRNIFGKLGVDIGDARFWESGIGEIEALLDETTALARKLGRIG